MLKTTHLEFYFDLNNRRNRIKDKNITQYP